MIFLKRRSLDIYRSIPIVAPGVSIEKKSDTRVSEALDRAINRTGNTKVMS